MKEIVFDEKQFYITGNIPCILLNMNESDYMNLLPQAQDITEVSKHACIWRYGNSFELHFEGDDKNNRKLVMIFSDTFEQLESTENFKFIPWLIHKNISSQEITDVSLAQIFQKLKIENIQAIIKYSKMMNTVELHLVKSGVVLFFENMDDNNISTTDIDIQKIYKNNTYKFTAFYRSFKDFSEYQDYKVINIADTKSDVIGDIQ